MSRRTELLFAWSGTAFVGLFFVGLLLFAHFVPPPSPAKSATEIASMYQDRTDSIRTGLAFVFIGCIFFFTFGASIMAQTRRIEGASRALCYLQIANAQSGPRRQSAPYTCSSAVGCLRQGDPNLNLGRQFWGPRLSRPDFVVPFGQVVLHSGLCRCGGICIEHR